MVTIDLSPSLNIQEVHQAMELDGEAPFELLQSRDVMVVHCRVLVRIKFAREVARHVAMENELLSHIVCNYQLSLNLIIVAENASIGIDISFSLLLAGF